MADENWDNEDILDELADAASLFEEIEKSPDRKDIGDILFVEGIEEDESVVDEDITPEDELEILTEPAMKTVPSAGRESNEPSISRPTQKKRPVVIRKKRVAVAVSASRGIGGTTIGELFAPLVRLSPPSKIRIERNSIASIFASYIGRVQV